MKICRNPYYVNKDPLKTIMFDGNNGSGKPMIYRNPFVPGASYGYDSTTYEKWQQSGRKKNLKNYRILLRNFSTV